MSTTIESLLDLDTLLSADDLELRTMVRELGESRLRPHTAEWFESGEVPVRDLAVEIGKLGLLGMHLEGYGCGGSTAMFAIQRRGSEEQREQWLPGMSAGELIGCFGLTEPDFGSDPGGATMWITNASIADVAIVWAREVDSARNDVVGFAVPTSTPGFSSREMTHKMSLRASVTSEFSLDDVRLPDDAKLPGARGLSGPLSFLSEARFGIVFGSVGAARDCLETTLDYVSSPGAGQDRGHGRRTRQGGNYSPCISGASRTTGRSSRNRSASASSTTFAKLCRLPGNAERCWAPTGSLSNTR